MSIYVGNLSSEMTEEELKGAFQEFGEVTSVNIIKDKFTGQPRGFGFVEMASGDATKAAIAGMSGKELKGRALTVNEARPKSDSGKRSFGSGGNRGGGGNFGGGRSFGDRGSRSGGGRGFGGGGSRSGGGRSRGGGGHRGG
ncbi:MAG: RNA-binding protein [Elusimicrobiota bacterium]